MTVLFKNDRFLIRNFVPDDLEAYLGLYTNALVTQYLPKRGVEENIKIFHSAFEDYAANMDLGKWGIFAVADNDYIGNCLLRLYNNERDKVEVGYALRQPYWGKGIASETAKTLVDYAFNRTKTPEVVAVTILENTGSQRVLEKAGLKRMDNINRDGLELAYFSLRRDEFKQ